MYKLAIFNSFFFFFSTETKPKPKINTYILNSHSQQPSCWKVCIPDPIIYGNVLNFYKFYIKKKKKFTAVHFVKGLFFVFHFFVCFVFFFFCLFCCCRCCLFVLYTGDFKIPCWGLSCLYFFGVPRGGVVPGL